ncbi:MAG TPA: glycosyltransferase [Capsulimonadaceae bacterium]|nr:glycosyltransferase [Capsulimonadaceae bacterium]
MPTEMKPGELAPNEPLFPRQEPAASAHSVGPVRVLFLNTRDQCGADVAVHLGLMHAFDRERALPYVLSNSQAVDAQAMARIYEEIPDLTHRFAPLGVPTEQLAAMSKLGKLKTMAPLAKSLGAALAQMRRDRIDIIHATDRPRDAAFSTLLARLSGKPNVVHMHSNCGDHLSQATLWGFRKASAVFAVSEYTRRELVALGLPEEKVFVVHNATDTREFGPDQCADSRDAVRREWGVPRDAPLVGIVARLIPWKGQRELIEAVARLSPNIPDLHLMIVGEGHDRDTLRRHAEKKGILQRVIFTGWHDDVRPLLASLDLFALPSYEEPFGLAITEAMAMQLSVIACNSGGVPEIITHGENGWLIAPRSAAELADAMRILLLDRRLRGSLATKARQTVVERFSPRRQADLVADLYSRLVIDKKGIKQ